MDQHVAVDSAPSQDALAERALVLRAREIPCLVVRTDAGFVLAVPGERAEEARYELAHYAAENRGWPPVRRAPAILSSGKVGAAAWCAVIGLFFLVQRGRLFDLAWQAAGRVDGERIAGGEWWRALTALTLHGDLAHLFGNMLFGAVFVALACQLVGTGVGLSGTLAAGALGNLVNAWVQGKAHLSIGASTAVFAAIGLQTAFLWSHHRRLRVSAVYVWAPVVLGLVFLAFLGMPSVQHDQVLDFLARPDEPGSTDYVAHATGFAAGLLIGWGVSRIPPERLAHRRGQHAAVVGASVVLLAAWTLALAVGRV